MKESSELATIQETNGGPEGSAGCHGRLPWLRPEELDQEQRDLYDMIVSGPRSKTQAFSLTDSMGRLEGPFNAMLVAAPLGVAQQALGTAIRYRSVVSDRQREIAVLELARIRQSSFELYAHVRLARTCGLSEAAIEALRDGKPCDELDFRDALVREIVTSVVEHRALNDDLFRRGVVELGLRVLVELVVLVGYYDALALSLAVWRTPLPADAAGED